MPGRGAQIQLCVLIASLAVPPLAAQLGSKGVSVSLRAKWEGTPLLLEAFEYVVRAQAPDLAVCIEPDGVRCSPVAQRSSDRTAPFHDNEFVFGAHRCWSICGYICVATCRQRRLPASSWSSSLPGKRALGRARDAGTASS